MSKPLAASRARSREKTEQDIIQAAASVLARDGWPGFGINAIARQARCNKVLIYRYFGSLENLAEALGRESDLWLGDAPAVPNDASYRDALWLLLANYLRKLRQSPFLRQALLAELIDGGAAGKALAAGRSTSAQAWFRSVIGSRTPRSDLDAAAIHAILIGGLHHLILCEGTQASFAGISLSTAKDWARIEQAFHTLVTLIHPTPR